MLCLERTTGNKIEVCEALLRRGILQVNEEKLLEDIILRTSRGLEGEMRADWFWEDLKLREGHLLFHNYETVKYNRFKHQIDTLFICERFALILEVKHIAGEIFYYPGQNQLVRQYNGRKLELGDPFSQVMRHEEWLQQFLFEMQIDLPIVTAVVITTHSSILNEMPARYHIFKLKGLRLKLNDWFEKYPKMVNQNVLQLLKKQLMLHYVPQNWQHPIKNLKLQEGALCNCGSVMNYKHGKFTCGCGNVSREALLMGLHDYRLLIDEWITNMQFRSFFKIESADTANKVLKRLNLRSEGTTKTKRYYIPKDIWREVAGVRG